MTVALLMHCTGHSDPAAVSAVAMLTVICPVDLSGSIICLPVELDPADGMDAFLNVNKDRIAHLTVCVGCRAALTFSLIKLHSN